MAKLERCLVGGTFDRFHNGHKELLITALDVAELVEVWITTDIMSAAKSPILQSFDPAGQQASQTKHPVLGTSLTPGCLSRHRGLKHSCFRGMDLDL